MPLRDDIIKLAHDNPGEIRDALLPILAKQAGNIPPRFLSTVRRKADQLFRPMGFEFEVETQSWDSVWIIIKHEPRRAVEAMDALKGLGDALRKSKYVYMVHHPRLTQKADGVVLKVDLHRS